MSTIIVVVYLVVGTLGMRYIVRRWRSEGVLTPHRLALASSAYPASVFLLAVLLTSEPSVIEYTRGVGAAVFFFLLGYLVGRVVSLHPFVQRRIQRQSRDT